MPNRRFQLLRSLQSIQLSVPILIFGHTLGFIHISLTLTRFTVILSFAGLTPFSLTLAPYSLETAYFTTRSSLSCTHFSLAAFASFLLAFACFTAILSSAGTQMVISVAMVLAKNMAPYIPRARVMARSIARLMAPYISMAEQIIKGYGAIYL